MNIVSLAVMTMLASFGSAFAQAASPDPSAQTIVVTCFCTQGGVWEPLRQSTRCSGAWTLTLQPSGGPAAHLVGGMSPTEVEAVLEATGVAYTPLNGDFLVVGRARLWFGEQGLEAFGRVPLATAGGN